MVVDTHSLRQITKLTNRTENNTFTARVNLAPFFCCKFWTPLFAKKSENENLSSYMKSWQKNFHRRKFKTKILKIRCFSHGMKLNKNGERLHPVLKGFCICRFSDELFSCGSKRIYLKIFA